ncbi:DUF262 domain-containing protein [Thermobifida alba]|uniref:DUF262 domain-containing protein n=1 Tax=Thermobifida alba TaxID=53522 RepID=A0ABY4KZS9_THEAE|nr:DUF262 domain-containing protein [Thermobifida alba]UPT19748.1 DUF262 domain-containing protein [Thermobifida alba]
MPTGLDNRPEATTYEVERLVQLAWRGQIRVPHFQRGFRWGRDDVIRLFDSIIKGYPVGSLLLWLRPAQKQRLTLGALSIDAPSMEEALWVVDGQQRVTSLASALHPAGMHDSRFALAYDLREERFVPLPPTTEPNTAPLPFTTEPHILPLPVLFDLPRLLQWFAHHPEVAALQDRAYTLTTILRQHPVPAYLVKQEDPEVLRDIFDRMNSYGKRLSRAEIFTALHAGDESDQEPALTFGVMAEQIDRQRAFGRIDDDTVHSSVLARRGPNVHREIRLEFSTAERQGTIDFPGEDRDTAFRKGEEALLRAVEFLQEDAGIPHFTLLPYRYLLVVLTRVFGHFPNPDPTNRRLLRRWLWRTALLGPEIFRGSTTGAVRQLCGKVRPGDLTGSVQDLLAAVERPIPPLPELRRFRTNEASAKITLCSWWALQPCDPSNGKPFDTSQLADALIDRSTVADAVRYVYPPSLLPTSHRWWAANRLFIPFTEDEVGKNAGHSLWFRPPTMSKKVWLDTLHSHLLTPETAELGRAQNIVPFLQQRQQAITNHLRDFLARMCEWDFEDTPPIDQLLIEDLTDEDDHDTL